MAKVLVTGSRGTIGRSLCRFLREQGHEVWESDFGHSPETRHIRADVGSFRELERVFDQDYDFVYHLAAEFGRQNGEEYYESVWRTNVIGTRNVLEWQLRKGFKLVFTSSSEIYGEANAPFLDEDLPLRQPVFPHNDYAISKWANELQIINFEKRHQVPVVRLRLFNAYGPGEYYHGYRSVVCQFVYRALHHLPYTVYLGYHRVFMYIDDLIPTMAKVIDRFTPGRVYNVSGRDYRSVEELSELVLRHTGGDSRLVSYLPLDRHNTTNKRPDIHRAERDLGHDPRVGLEEGIPKTVSWMRQTYEV